MVFFIIIVVLFALFFAFLLWGAYLNRQNNKKLMESGFTPNIKIAGLQIDEQHGLWNKSGMNMTLKLSEIIDCEVIEDGISYKSDHGVLRAVVGGALFGSTGAIIGAMTSSSSEQINKMYVCIHTDNPILPKINIELISQPTSKNSSLYKMNKSSAESIISYIDKLSGFSFKKQSSNTSIMDKNATKTSDLSNADELAKYKKLLDEGAISEEEYASVKRRLLNLE